MINKFFLIFLFFIVAVSNFEEKAVIPDFKQPSTSNANASKTVVPDSEQSSTSSVKRIVTQYEEVLKGLQSNQQEPELRIERKKILNNERNNLN